LQRIYDIYTVFFEILNSDLEKTIIYSIAVLKVCGKIEIHHRKKEVKRQRGNGREKTNRE
jgi:hypothetical protein